MRVPILAAAMALALAGCTAQDTPTGPGGQDPAGPAGAVARTPADPGTAPEIGVMDWPELRYHCTFSAQGHDLDRDDESTWRFVLVTPFTPSRRDDWAVAAVDGERQIWSLVAERRAGRGEVRRYALVDDPEIELEAVLLPAGRADGANRYTGTLQIVAPAVGEPVEFSGDCRR